MPKLRTKLVLFFLLIFFVHILNAQINNTEFQIDYSPAQIDVCQSTSNSEVSVLAKDIGLSSFEITIGLPPGILYEAGSISIVTSPLGYAATEVNISDLSNPVFSIDNGSAWNAGDEVVFTITRSASCDAVDHSLNSGTFKEEVYVSYNDGGTPKIDSDTDPAVNSYQVNYGVLSILPIATTFSTVGTFETRDVVVRQGGLGCLSEYEHYVVVGRDLTNYNLYFNGSLLTPFNVAPNGSTTADTLFYDIDMSLAPFNAVGNANGCFDNGEEMLYVETFLISGCDDASSFHHSNWGCNSNICQASVPQEGVVNISNGVPDIKMVPISKPTADLCELITYEMLITNNGVETNPPGGAVATDFAIIFGLGSNNTPISTPGQPTTWGSAWNNTRNWNNFRINGYPVLDSALLSIITNRGTASFLPPNYYTTNPDGPGGLDDIDNDGFFDDLPIGDTLIVSFDYWITPKNLVCDDNINDYMYWEHLYFDITWENQCGQQAPSKRVDLNYSNIIKDYRDPTRYTGPLDIGDGDVFTVDLYTYLSIYGANAPKCNGQPMLNSQSSDWTVTLDLPPGVSLGPNPQPNPLHVNLNPSIVQVGNQIIYTIDRFVQSNYPIELQFDCASSIGNVINIPVTTHYSCSNSNGDICWEADMHCHDLLIATHCGAPCTGPVTTDFDAKRTTPGWTDSYMTDQVDLENGTGYNLDFYFPFDTMNISSGCIISDTALTDLQYRITYSNTAKGIDQIKLLDASIEIFDISSGTMHSFPITNIPSPITTSANNFSLTFDLSPFNQMVSSTYLYGGDLSNPGDYSRDSIHVSANFEVAGDFNVNVQYQMTNFSGAYFTFNQDGDTIQCDKYNDRASFERARLRSGAIEKSFEGCEVNYAPFLFYQLTASGDNYPNEYRPPYRLDSFKINIPPTLTFTGRADIRNTEMGTITNIQTNLVGNTLWLYPPPGWRDIDKKASDYGVFFVGFKATCSTAAITTITYEWHGSEFFYHPNPAVHSHFEKSFTPQKSYYNPPTFSIQANNPNQSGVRQEVSWDVDICNTTSFANVGFNWLNIENNPNVVITGIAEVAGGVETPLPYLVNPDGIYVQFGSLNSIECKTVRITAEYSDCGVQTIDVGHNWDCDSYPSSLSVDDPTCYLIETLTINPQPAQVQLSIIDQPNTISLCSLLTYELEINSAQLADIVDPNFSILFNNAPGITVNSVSFEYPAGSGNIETLNATVSTSSLFYDLNDHTAIAANTGINGTITATNPDDRKISVSISLITDCDFVSGSSLRFLVGGSQPCGDPAIGDQTVLISDNLEIPQAQNLYDANVSITTNALNTVCNSSSQIDVQIFITGGSTTGSDSSYLTLPIGTTFDTGTFSCTASAGVFCPTYTVTTVNGQDILVMMIPSGMNSGDILDFSFEVTADQTIFLPGDSLEILNTTDLNNIACGNSFCSSISAQTGYGTAVIDIDRTLTASVSGSAPVVCFGEGSGSATATATGGNTPYTYLWSNGTVNGTATGLLVGNYFVTVTDSKGCESVDSVYVSSPAAIGITLLQNDLSCNGANDGVISASSIGGTPGYSYQWSTGAITPVISGIGVGTYIVSVTDANGCIMTASTNIVEPDILGCNILVTDASCNGYKDGLATAMSSGGTPGYSYLWGSGAYSQTNQTAYGLGAGTYDLTITDSRGCLTQCSVTVNQPTRLTVSINTLDESCIGLADGEISLSTIGGSPGYSYQWDAAAGGLTTPTISGLVSGTYDATITDDVGCTAFVSVIVETANCDPCSLDICAVLASDTDHPLSIQDCDGDGVLNDAECTDNTDPKDQCDFVETSITLPVTADQSDCLNLCPDLSPVMTILPGNIAGMSAVEVAIEVVELNAVDTDGGAIIVRMPSDPRLVFVWDIALTQAALVPVQNANWNYLGDNGFVHTWTYSGPNQVILAGMRSALGFQSFYDPQATDGQTTLTATIIPFGGGECKIINNTDSERLVYFQ